MKINIRLSNWDATSFCPCHTWQFQPSPGRSPDGDAKPVATAQQAAGAVRDLWMCYAAAGVRYNDVVGVVR